MKKTILLLVVLAQIIVINKGFSQGAVPVVKVLSDPACVGDQVQFSAQNSVPGAGASVIISYNWTFDVDDVTGGTNAPFPPGNNQNDIEPITKFRAPGLYKVRLTVQDDGGNTATLDTLIDIQDCNPTKAEFGVPELVCEGDCITIKNLTLGNPISYQWNIVNATNPPGGTAIVGDLSAEDLEICFYHTDIVPVSYFIDLQVKDGYTDPQTNSNLNVQHTFVVYPRPKVQASEDTIIELGGIARLETIFAEGGSVFKWEPAEFALSPTDYITSTRPIYDTTEFILTYSTATGCTATDTIIVYTNFQPIIDVPGAFSPNGDGLNDLLIVKGPGIETIRFKVYNRFGQLLYESDRQKNGWDGNFKGKPESPGVYLWTIDYEFYTGQVGKLTGSTTLVR